MTKQTVHAEMLMAVRTVVDTDGDPVEQAKINFAAGDFETGVALSDAKGLIVEEEKSNNSLD